MTDESQNGRYDSGDLYGGPQPGRDAAGFDTGMTRRGSVLNRIIETDSGELILERYIGNCCAGVFLTIWVLGWTYGLSHFLAEAIHNPANSDWFAVMFMGLFWLAGVGALAWSWTGREKLLVDDNAVQWEQRAIFRFRTRSISLLGIESVDIEPIESTNQQATENHALVIRGGGQDIRYGLGLDVKELLVLLTVVREHLGKQPSVHLPPAESAEQIESLHLEQQQQGDRQQLDTPVEKLKETVMMPVGAAVGLILILLGCSAIAAGFWLMTLVGLVFVGMGLLSLIGNLVGIYLAVKDRIGKGRNS